MSFFLHTSSCPPSCPYLWRSPSALTTLLSVITWTYLLTVPSWTKASTLCKQPGLQTFFTKGNFLLQGCSSLVVFLPLWPVSKTPLATPQDQLDGNRGVTLSSHPSGAPSGYQGCSIAMTWADTGYLGKVDCSKGWERKRRFNLMTSVNLL